MPTFPDTPDTHHLRDAVRRRRAVRMLVSRRTTSVALVAAVCPALAEHKQRVLDTVSSSSVQRSW